MSTSAAGPSTRCRARKEVIVCGGTVNSPRLLQLSGVGSGSLLKSLGVEVVHDLPAVGENFRDHCSVRLVARAKNSKTINEITRGPALVGQVLRWLTGRPSVIGVSPSLCYCFWKSDPNISGADLQLVFSPASYKEGFVGMLDDYPGMSCGVWQHRPESIGYVRAKSTDIFVDPAIQPNYLSHEADQRALVGGIKLARRLLGTPQLSRFVDRETFPGDGVRTDDEILHWARQYGGTVWHLIGTCRMGPADRQVERGERRAQGPWPAEPARDRRLGHAEHAVGQHLFGHHGDRREGLRPDPGQGRAGAGGAAGLVVDASAYRVARRRGLK